MKKYFDRKLEWKITYYKPRKIKIIEPTVEENVIIDKNIKKTYNMRNYINRKYSNKNRELILKKFNYTCQNCNINLINEKTNLHIHHIIPISNGGTDEDKNLTVLCFNCHAEKHKYNKFLYNIIKMNYIYNKFKKVL